MQIKRFEADDMTEALRRVKREFGDSAVILSAKEVRPRGFFSALKKKRVEIAAATDYPAAEKADEDDAFQGLLAQQLADEPPTDMVSLSTGMRADQAAASYARASAQSPRRTQKEDGADPVDTGLPKQPFESDRIEALLGQALRRGSAGSSAGVETAAENRIERRATDHLVAAPFYGERQPGRRIALVGPAGTGKSSAVAKLALHCQGVANQRAALISLDRFRLGANATLVSVSRILNLPLMIVHDGEQLRTALEELGEMDVVLIDTPGIGAVDPDVMADIGELLGIAAPDEIHLVLNATVRREVLSDAVKTFSPLNVNRILFTHMDEFGSGASVLELLKEMGLPSAFFTDGMDLFDHLKETSIDRLKRFCSDGKPAGGQVAVFPGKRNPHPGKILPSIDNGPIHFVANRNSELFHHPNCRSVKRINAENVIAFNSIEQAMEEGFKPCRACCNIGMIRKAANGAFGDRHACAL
jgi:flagellar biosynthesis protein FlhF